MIAVFVVACGNQSTFFRLRSQINGDGRQVLILFQPWEIGWEREPILWMKFLGVRYGSANGHDGTLWSAGPVSDSWGVVGIMVLRNFIAKQARSGRGI